MEELHLGRQFLRRLSVEGQEILVLQKLMLDQLKGIGEWNDLIIQNPLQIEPQALEIGELVDKKPGEALVLQPILKHQVEEEMERLIPLRHLLQG